MAGACNCGLQCGLVVRCSCAPQVPEEGLHSSFKVESEALGNGNDAPYLA